MGYFSNGVEGDIYQNQYCDNCKRDDDNGCVVWMLHFTYNYEECNKKDSILHKMIPRDQKGNNEKCIFFKERKTKEVKK